VKLRRPRFFVHVWQLRTAILLVKTPLPKGQSYVDGGLKFFLVGLLKEIKI